MLGVLITLLVALGACGLGIEILRRWTADLDPAARFGTGGLVGLGALGLLTLPIGLIPGGLRWGVGVIVIAAAAGLFLLYRETKQASWKPAAPKGADLLFPIVIGLAMLFSLVGVLAPSDSMDWDSLAYHLAVPKMWLRDGAIHYISYIHHSNFPFVVDNLYIWGLLWGDQHGAKAFSWTFTLFGLLAIFGIARARYGERAAWWSTLAFATIPAVIWLSGTAYVDVSNGLFAGLGILFAALLVESGDRRNAWLSAIFLGLAAGSKYTGLQTIFAVGAVLLAYGLLRPKESGATVKSAFLVGLVALAIASPWYLKNVAFTGNPVFPFFYSVLGGKNWDAFSAKIYTEEQKTFGIGSAPANLGAAVLGLGYQPGRYINPGQTAGGGFPTGAWGVVALSALMAWCLGGKLRRFEGAVLAAIGISFLIWFGLSQQSRYILGLAVPLSVLAGGAVARLRAGPVIAGLVGGQAAYSLFLLNTLRVSDQLPAAIGKVSASEFQEARVPFFAPAGFINSVVKDGKVALYDEVFGYFLDVPYFWAGPGHTTEIGYEALNDGAGLVASLKKLGITHVYLNFSIYNSKDPNFQRWVEAMGLTGQPPRRYEGEERAAQSTDIRNKWKVLIADAVADGKLVPIQSFKRGLLLHLE